MSDKNKNLPLVLLILDGWGLCETKEGNAIALAKTPVLDKIYKNYPNTKLCAHGECVGLLKNQDGNSEAGHMNIGSGRIVEQETVYISKCISDGTFFQNSAFRHIVEHVKKNKSNLHIMGLLSTDDSAHSNPDHLIALLTLANSKNVKVFLHLFTDGRDSHQHSAIKLLERLKFYLRPDQHIATIMGRIYAMDRKKKWERIKMAYEALTQGKGIYFSSPTEAITASYNKGDSDEFIAPSIITTKNKKTKKQKPITTINNNDGVIFYNLRSDRARELTKAFVQDKFIGFKRKKVLRNIFFTAMADFGPDLPGITTAFSSRDLKGTLPIVLRNFRQVYMAETEKYAHVTYFFNGGYDSPVGGEDRVLIKSPNIDHYDKVPEMKVYELTKKMLSFLIKDKYDIIVCNFANSDMVGHTGNLEASIKAAESEDRSIGDIAKQILKLNGTLIITADHGNIEEMIDLKTGEIDTAHSKYPVPFIIVNKKLKNIKLRAKGVLGDVAPTILDVLNIQKPKEMRCKTLVSRRN
ncbi:2,3-bisphosphoglycerate-independent phosphoglycerate mutase [bacterium]|nr:2,3-bisphosphoglycerate-independent phosphoglycerate mutase [bacterium]